ncbi:MAG: hypothetical protein EAZ47_10180 [Bacteroidetes bacterium]|nr:MAG: hypothetical protein EAY72_03665 [Bacteroidota bacterium]TAE69188.1 MAG: hypothetical protein EAY68_03905 [Bacteroidota bacterium]TAF91264.1 MAG: hypothetical protein EAZ47_10180 [Bacteroidota bacterium]
MQTLLQKLQFKTATNVLLWQAPENIVPLLDWPAHVVVHYTMPAGGVDFVLAFVHTQADVVLAAQQWLPALALENDVPLWFCYIKGSSKTFTTDINRDKGWEPLTPFNLEPVRQIAVNNDWSALRFRSVAFIKTMQRSFATTAQGIAKVQAQKK